MPDDKKDDKGVAIDRLALQLTGLSEKDGRRLAMLVSEGLAAAGLGAKERYQIGTVRITADAKPGATVERLSQQIVADLVGQIRRSG